MKIIVFAICLSTLILSCTADHLNPVNPNFNYPEAQKINKFNAEIPYAGDIWDGYIQVNNTSKSKLFYILYPAGGSTHSATINNSAPLILWLQGGPGCSDGAGNYLEIGPFTVANISGKLTPTLQSVTWNDQFNLLFIDSPVGVGYSVSGNEHPNNAMDTARYLQTFLIRFFQVYPSLAKNDFYIFGESFGGHYIPALATIITQNVTNNKINLKGIGVGDGWTDPYTQVGSFSDFCFAAGLLDVKQRDIIKNLESEAQRDISQGQYAKGASVFDQITDKIVELNSNIDIYNFQIYNLPSDFPYDDWLEMHYVKQAYGVDPNVTYQDCVDSTYDAFANDIGYSYAQNYTYLLTQTNLPNLKVLLYSGQNDIICNTLGTLRWVAKLQWAGLPYFEAAARNPMNDTNGNIVGFYKNYQRLSFAIVNDGGHMLPWDQPVGSRIMLKQFTGI